MTEIYGLVDAGIHRIIFDGNTVYKQNYLTSFNDALNEISSNDVRFVPKCDNKIYLIQNGETFTFEGEEGLKDFVTLCSGIASINDQFNQTEHTNDTLH